MENIEPSSVFSNWFEKLLLKMLEKYFDKFVELAEQKVGNPGFIKQKNALKYYDGIDAETLKKYEANGLERHEPVKGGHVFYKISELDRFMLEN